MADRRGGLPLKNSESRMQTASGIRRFHEAAGRCCGLGLAAPPAGPDENTVLA